jgi:hypothetical protein
MRRRVRGDYRAPPGIQTAGLGAGVTLKSLTRHLPLNRGRRAFVGLLLCAAFTLQCHDASSRGQFGPVEPVSIEVLSSAVPASFPTTDKNERLAHTNPLEFFRRCREHYDQTIHGYRCNFLKQERVGDKLTSEQVTDVRFLNDPYSVDMVWTRNAGPAARALYVKGKWRNNKGQEEAWVRPSGAVLGLLKIKQPIDGPRAQKAARRRIDQFGFRSSLDLIIKYSEKAARNHELDLRFIGDGHIENRPTYVFERRLPTPARKSPTPIASWSCTWTGNGWCPRRASPTRTTPATSCWASTFSMTCR